MSKSSKLVFFGNERLATAASTAAPTLQALIAAGYEIEAVIASHNDAVSRQKRELEIGAVAHAHGIPVILPGEKYDLLSKLRNHRTEAAILVAFGRIIPKGVIGLFPKGIINIHPSLLPRLRGATPVETAILEGLDETGVSLMKITAEMDAGPVYAQTRVPLNGTETKLELATKLSGIGSKLLLDNLPDILGGSLQPVAQDGSEATYCRPLTKEMGIIDFNEPALAIERKVRAFEGYPKTSAKLFEKHQVVITKARVAQGRSDGELVIACNPGWLEITELITPNGKRASGASFMRGYLKT